jgi:16S rRNA processing protein RimM
MSGHAPDDVAMKDIASGDIVAMGRIDGLFGIKGWVKVYSYTRPRETILKYRVWKLKLAQGWREFEVAEGRKQGAGVVARLQGIEDRDAASALIRAEIAIERSVLPKLKAGEYYWTDLEGLKVVNLEGVEFGTVSHLFETGGSNDVLVVRGDRERLVPFTKHAIREVDLENGIIRVDWDPEF